MYLIYFAYNQHTDLFMPNNSLQDIGNSSRIHKGGQVLSLSWLLLALCSLSVNTNNLQLSIDLSRKGTGAKGNKNQ